MKEISMKKLYYSISEVSKMTEVEQYVLRYWETEFEELKPQKNRAGNRIYSNKDIQLILYIKNLLRNKKYTIEGAKKILENYLPGEQNLDGKLTKESVASEEINNNVDKIKKDKFSLKKDLEEIKNILEFLYTKI